MTFHDIIGEKISQLTGMIDEQFETLESWIEEHNLSISTAKSRSFAFQGNQTQTNVSAGYIKFKE